MEISGKHLVHRFYEEVAKDKYPNYTRKQIIDVCYTPFRYFRKAMKNYVMPIIRFKYLGEFQPNVFKIVRFLNESNKQCFIDKVEPHWRHMMRSNCQTVINREICELHERFENEKGLLTKTVSEEEYHRLLKLYSSHIIKDDYDNKKQD